MFQNIKLNLNDITFCKQKLRLLSRYPSDGQADLRTGSVAGEKRRLNLIGQRVH